MKMNTFLKIVAGNDEFSRKKCQNEIKKSLEANPIIKPETNINSIPSEKMQKMQIISITNK